jgi:hypothetical protein
MTSLENSETSQEEPVTLQSTYYVAKCVRLGRYLAASRDLRKGEIIFQEYPIAAAPQKNSSLICPGCFGRPNIEVCIYI